MRQKDRPMADVKNGIEPGSNPTRRRRRDLTEAERREIAERLAPARAEADRIAAPLMALQWAEMDAEVILLAKKVDGVYDSDPNQNSSAVKFDSIKYLDVINKGLGVMDTTATSLCMDNEIPILVFGLDHPENITKAIRGENIGTLVKN